MIDHLILKLASDRTLLFRGLYCSQFKVFFNQFKMHSTLVRQQTDNRLSDFLVSDSHGLKIKIGYCNLIKPVLEIVLVLVSLATVVKLSIHLSYPIQS
ncbi:hypothetical protein O181_082413 [Austropuccinia psidii MF-1]|uniref:Uncharacterized protein n=1 Tax=Austropuccinia psidii MF-1 TaxID=1389203 RepID=A0A9Q3FRQ0_9BASI|nr:hypothetical protein [Austropuccinia psidii MF-1]